MYRQSPSGRSLRSSKSKVKYVVQVCVLLVICFWLIYQVKRSHEKNKQLDGNESRLSTNSDEIPRLGRKDILPHSKDNNDEETEEEQDNSEDKINDSDDNENDDDSKSMHEAQEMLYKADDVSSAVTHDTQIVINPEENALKKESKVDSDKEISSVNTTSFEGSGDDLNERNSTQDFSLSGKTDSTLVSNNVVSDSLAELRNEDPELTESDSSAESTHTESSGSEESVQGHPRFSTQDDRWSSTMVDETGKTDEGFESFNNDDIGGVQDLVDSSVSNLNEKDVRTDLETLPEIQTEGSNTEDAEAE